MLRGSRRSLEGKASSGFRARRERVLGEETYVAKLALVSLSARTFE